ncbi:hypothetical protein MPLSOD_260076 [Mesorhizobium sp. SOD10]|nr:hypothetical protein MPLSOD_260076 [Mesorhizobium sp. SOD10]
MIAEAMQEVGNEGVITVEEAKIAETELEVVEACNSTAVISRPVCADPREEAPQSAGTSFGA